MKIWQRYIFSYLLSSFFFFLVSILGLYITIDFSIHGARFLTKDTTSWLDIGINYLRHFARFTPLFFSFAFLLSLLKVLLDLNTHREIVALQTAGLSTKRLLSPFFFLAAFLSIASYANFQWIAPETEWSGSHLHKKRAAQVEKILSLVLEDSSELIYQHYDSKKKQLFDVFWIRSFNDIWHMKILTLDASPFQAQFADHFMRKNNGVLEKVDSADIRLFPELHIEEGVAFQRFIPFENRSLSTLWRQSHGDSADKEKSAAYLHYKLAVPLIPFLMIFSFAPFALRFSRSSSSLLFIASSLFVFVGFMTLLDAMLILAENQALPAIFSIWAPFGIYLTLSLYFFSRMR